MKPILVDGQWLETPTALPNINPSDTSDIIDHYCQAGIPEIETAISAAVDAQPKWADTSPQVRSDILSKVGNEILSRKEEIGKLLAREEGKTIAEGVAETARAGNIFLFFAGEALRIAGEKYASLRQGVEVDITREAVGVVGIITPWNFPMAIPAWKVAPALCYGNSVLLKPAELVPGCAWTIADIIHRAGVPAGVFNFVPGKGSVIGQAMLDDPRVNAITFTGSQVTAQQVAASSIRHMRKMQLEMGGKNPLVVLDDADIDTAVHCAVDGGFFSTGQRCTASSRLIVTESIHNQFIEACLDKMRSLKIGHALELDTDIGPVADQSQLEKNLHYVENAKKEGGYVRQGGNLLSRPTNGFYFEPALITDTTPMMTINKEEVFGPVVSVIRVRDYEEALATANDSEMGLSAGICTTSLKHATHFRQNCQSGMVMINLPTAGVDYHVPFGGTKSSSYGSREQGRHAVEFFTKVKTSYISS